MGPHPAVAEVRRLVRDALRDDPPSAVLVACSGGADSVALASAAAFEGARTGLRVGLITCDHGLQGGSPERARAVAQLGYDLGLDPVLTVPVDVAGLPGGPEAAARQARYRALDAAAQALDAVVLLGHTLDDQAETVLLGLGRGSGPRSIAGMRPVSGRYRRPLLTSRRATTRAACQALGLAVWDDPHNIDPAFRRVRLRLEVLPLLEDVLDGGAARALARTASLLGEDLDALDELAATALAGALDADGAVLVNALADQPVAITGRVLKRWAELGGTEPLTAVHVAGLQRLVTDWHGQAAIPLPGGFAVRRASGRLELRADRPDGDESLLDPTRG